jgi:GTP-binding protein Era
MLKKVGRLAREELEEYFQKKVFLELFVKVEPDWRNSPRILRELNLL